MAYFIALDRAFTPCSLETFDRGLRNNFLFNVFYRNFYDVQREIVLF
jgi:hypothetical protein